jgi:flagellar biosynthesis protein FliQ
MMIRLMADTWREAVLRPLAMAAPNAWVYTEIMAPDFRFALALGLVLIVFIATATKKTTAIHWRPVIVLFGLTFSSFVPWMATSGNGRYFMPYLLLIGPLCIGLISILACSRSMKASVTLLVLIVQGHALYLNNPWSPSGSWALVPWLETGYFPIELDQRSIDPATTYISVTSPAFTLVAPQFPAESRWVNLSAFDDLDVTEWSIGYDPVRKILQTSKSLETFSAQHATSDGCWYHPAKSGHHCLTQCIPQTSSHLVERAHRLHSFQIKKFGFHHHSGSR